MKKFLDFEEVIDLLNKSDEMVFKSEDYDLYFTFLGIVDAVYERCNYGSDYDLVNDVYKEMVEDIFGVDWDYNDLDEYNCDLKKEEVYNWLNEHWWEFQFTEVTMEDIEELVA